MEIRTNTYKDIYFKAKTHDEKEAVRIWNILMASGYHSMVGQVNEETGYFSETEPTGDDGIECVQACITKINR